MSKERRHALGAFLTASRGRIAVLALILSLGFAVGHIAGGTRAGEDALPKAMTLEEMERSGKIVLAYSHSADDLARMLDSDDYDLNSDPAAEWSYAVTVVADGTEHEVVVTRRNTVQEILDKVGVTLGPEDQLSHFLAHTVNAGARIVVERWTRDTHVSEKLLPYETVEIPSSLLSPGKRRVVYEGAHGVALQTFDRVLMNDVVMEQTLVEEEIVLHPISRRVLVGTEYAPISPYDFEWEFDENGEPIGYEDVLEDGRAAGYSARPGAGTACGYLKADVGHVAVNPNVIPYGSKLYIRSTDGKFVYGYAIAADTGTSLMQGIIEVDLFYDTYDESCLNGMRQVDIYILEYPQ